MKPKRVSMDGSYRMRVISTLICFMIISSNHAVISGADGPVLALEALEGGNVTLLCDSNTNTPNDELMLLVWYKDKVPVYSYDARISSIRCLSSSSSSNSFNSSNRLRTDSQTQPTVLIITQLRGDDQALYHCRVDFLLAPTRNLGVNLTIIVLQSAIFLGRSWKQSRSQDRSLPRGRHFSAQLSDYRSRKRNVL